MTVINILTDKSANWIREKGAEEAKLRELISGCDFELPDAYLELLRYSNGGEGELSIEPGWFQLWPAEEVNELNEKFGVKELAYGFFGFGSNGGGELLAFKSEEKRPQKVYMIPFIGMEELEVIQIADSFEDFVKAMGREFNECN